MNPDSASLKDVIRALNGFYSTYLERCIKENQEFAAGTENNCYGENCSQNDKVIVISYCGYL